jgi:hypothetical protein
MIYLTLILAMCPYLGPVRVENPRNDLDGWRCVEVMKGSELRQCSL